MRLEAKKIAPIIKAKIVNVGDKTPIKILAGKETITAIGTRYIYAN